MMRSASSSMPSFGDQRLALGNHAQAGARRRVMNGAGRCWVIRIGTPITSAEAPGTGRRAHEFLQWKRQIASTFDRVVRHRREERL